MSESAGALASAEAEIVRHHEVIRRWLAGRMPRAEFSVLADAHAPEFTLVGPDGAALSRKAVLDGLERAYGTAPGLVIEIAEVSPVAVAGPLAVVSYVERQPGLDLRSTVVFRREAGHGPRWLHLHETRIARRAGRPPAGDGDAVRRVAETRATRPWPS